MTSIIAIGNQKGGVAKTTTCLSLGASLAELGQTVLLIDADPQGSLTLSLGVQPDEMRRSLEDALLGNASLMSVSRETSVFGLDLVPAGRGLLTVDKILYSRANYEYNLKNVLAALPLRVYDTVLIDCPPTLATLTLNALTAAELLMIPMQCEYYAAHALRQVIELVKAVRARTNPQLKYRVLVTMYDRRNNISRVIYEQLQQGVGALLFKTVIEVDTKLRESPVYHQPVTVYAPTTRGAEQYRALARELTSHDA
ncbi:MAG: ParA family protein [Thermoflexales bacterium]|nr:ParA family protein [Thermoflexales bacterium]